MDMILYEDRDLIVCRKPAGLAVQSAAVGQKDMVSLLNNYLADSGQAGKKQEDQYIRVVHRLDQPVEGVLVFAKTKRAAAGLGSQVSSDQMKKVYDAVCCCGSDTDGEPAQEHVWKTGTSFTLVDYLVRDGRTNTSSVTEAGAKDAKRASLSFTVVQRIRISDTKELLRVRIDLQTGRHHQIRVQMANAGLPLAGDCKYNTGWGGSLKGLYDAGLHTLLEQAYGVSGAEERKRDIEKKPLTPALCAAELTFFHPVTKKQMTFRTEPQSGIFALMRESELDRNCSAQS